MSPAFVSPCLVPGLSFQELYETDPVLIVVAANPPRSISRRSLMRTRCRTLQSTSESGSCDSDSDGANEQCWSRIRVSHSIHFSFSPLHRVVSVHCRSLTHPPSPLTLLRSRTLFGRPAFGQIFSSICKSIDGGSYLPGREATLKTRLGVYYCGVSRTLFHSISS